MDEVEKSTHKVEVVRVRLRRHENADRLSVARVFDYDCVTETTQWEGRELAAYLPPDTTVDVNRPEFSFLAKEAKANGRARIKAKKLRGVLSFGLLVPAPEGSQEGDDVAELLDCGHYEPPLPGEKAGGLFMGGEVAKAPDVYVVKYDVDAGRRYASRAFESGEPVCITEKIHGCLQADTRIQLANGEERRIADVVVGDVVLSYRDEDNGFVSSVVTATIRRPECLGWLRLTFDSCRSVTCTKDHRFLTSNRGWVAAVELTEADEILTPNHQV